MFASAFLKCLAKDIRVQRGFRALTTLRGSSAWPPKTSSGMEQVIPSAPHVLFVAPMAQASPHVQGGHANCSGQLSMT